MSASVLVRNETLKTTRRTAFWVTLLSFAAIASLAVGQDLHRALAHPGGTFTFTLPAAWALYLPTLGPLPSIFASVAVVLLITSEFSWRTARQNVIDGLSKEAFFAGKLFTWLAVTLTFVAAMVAIVGGLGLVGTHHAGSAGPLVRSTDVALVGGGLLCALGYSSLAYLSAFATRSSGAGMGLFLLYVGFVDQIVHGLLMRAGNVGKAMAAYLPRGVFDSLLRAAQYDPTARQQLVEQLAKAGREAPHFMSTELLVAVAALWIVAFVGLAFWVYEKRDL